MPVRVTTLPEAVLTPRAADGTAGERHPSGGALFSAATVSTFVALVLSTGAIIAQHVLVARVLGPDGKGAYDLLVTTAGLVGLTLGLSLPTGVTYVVARGRAHVRRLTVRLAALVLVQGTLAAILIQVAIVTPFAPMLLPAGADRWIAPTIGLFVAAVALYAVLRAALLGRREIVAANRRDVSARVTQVGLLAAGALAAALLGREVNFGLFFVLTVAGTVVAVALVAPRVFASRDAPEVPSGLGEVLSFAIPCHANNVAQYLNYRLDIFFVNALVGTAAVGVYTLSIAVAQLIWLFGQAAATVLLPTVAAEQDRAADNARGAAFAARMTTVLSLAATIALAAVAGFAMPALFGEAFQGSVRPLLLLLPGIVAFVPVTVIASYFVGIGRPDYNLRISLVGLAVTVALDVSLVPLWGIAGAAVATTVSYVASAAVMAQLFVRHAGLSVQALFLPTATDVRAVLAAIRALVDRRAERA